VHQRRGVFYGGTGPHSLLGQPESCIPNGISISAAVFFTAYLGVQHTDTIYSSCYICRVAKGCNCVLCTGDDPNNLSSLYSSSCSVPKALFIILYSSSCTLILWAFLYLLSLNHHLYADDTQFLFPFTHLLVMTCLCDKVAECNSPRVLINLAKWNFLIFPGFPDPLINLFQTIIKWKPNVTNHLSSQFSSFLAEL